MILPQNTNNNNMVTKEFLELSLNTLSKIEKIEMILFEFQPQKIVQDCLENVWEII